MDINFNRTRVNHILRSSNGVSHGNPVMSGHLIFFLYDLFMIIGF